MDIVIRDSVVDKYAPQRSYTYRFLKAYTDGKLAVSSSHEIS